MTIRLGEVLVEQGVLNEQQVEQILKHQRTTHRPFGLLAEELFGCTSAQIEAAWAEQYRRLGATVDITRESIEERALDSVSRRQAWQFRVMPLRFEGAELVIATTAENLARALRFASRVLSRPCYLVLTEPEKLGEALAHHFPMGGLTPEAVVVDRA
jgi:hypothetical protein